MAVFIVEHNTGNPEQQKYLQGIVSLLSDVDTPSQYTRQLSILDGQPSDWVDLHEAGVIPIYSYMYEADAMVAAESASKVTSGGVTRVVLVAEDDREHLHVVAYFGGGFSFKTGLETPFEILARRMRGLTHGNSEFLKRMI